jgi:hypothetical protein
MHQDTRTAVDEIVAKLLGELIPNNLASVTNEEFCRKTGIQPKVTRDVALCESMMCWDRLVASDSVEALGKGVLALMLTKRLRGLSFQDCIPYKVASEEAALSALTGAVKFQLTEILAQRDHGHIVRREDTVRLPLGYNPTRLDA